MCQKVFGDGVLLRLQHACIFPRCGGQKIQFERIDGQFNMGVIGIGHDRQVADRQSVAVAKPGSCQNQHEGTKPGAKEAGRFHLPYWTPANWDAR